MLEAEIKVEEEDPVAFIYSCSADRRWICAMRAIPSLEAYVWPLVAVAQELCPRYEGALSLYLQR